MSTTPYSLADGPFTQNWTNTGLINANDDWSGVPSIVGYLGDIDTGTTADVDPQTRLEEGLGAVDIIANQANPNTFTNGGVAEFDGIANPVVAFQGSGAADAPSLVFYLDTTGVNNVNVAYNLRDIDGSTDNAVQQVALQYRIGTTGDFINLPAGYVPDASTGPSSATQVIPVSVTLPAAVNNQPQVQVRVITTNAGGSDELIGVDDIVISSGTITPGTPTVSIQATDSAASEAGPDPGNFRITRTGDTSAALDVSYTVATGAGQANNGTDYTPTLSGTATIPVGATFVDIPITPVEDSAVEGNETATLTLVDTAAYDLGASTATVTIADNDGTPGTTRIRDIQGAVHVSPLNGQTVTNVPGIVTAVRSNGFYLQDPNPDTNDATSEGIFVFTSSAPTVSVSNSVLVSGTVSEFRPGGSGGTDNLSITQIGSPTITTVSSGNPLPANTILGNGGRSIPTTVISNDAAGGSVENPGTVFDPAEDGIDFYESLEGMLVQVNNAVAVSPTNNFGEISVLADNGANAGTRTARGGIVIQPTDFNPERIIIDDLINPTPGVNVGDTFSTVTGVIDYSFGNFKLLNTAPLSTNPGGLARETTTLTGSTNQLTVATFNVENLDPNDGPTKFNALASAIVSNLKAPDIISLEEVQDNNGPTNDSVVDATTTYQTLINAIAAQPGGPTYEFRQINPMDDTNGGEPGGNIRVGFLFNPNRVDFVDRPGGSSTTDTTVNTGASGPQLSSSPGLIDPDNSAFNNSRKPLAGEFIFNGNTVFVIGNHFNSKGGDQPLFGRFQPPELSSEVQRQQQATVVRDFVRNILAADPNANVAVVGDLNDFQFSNPITTLENVENGGLNNLIETLPLNDQYTFIFDGNSQVLDQILVSDNLLNSAAEIDVVHLNAEFADQVSDHEPLVARFNLVNPNDTFATSPNSDVINTGIGNDTVTSTFTNLQQDNINGGTGIDTFVITGGAATDTLTINVATTTNQLTGIPGTTVANFEQFDLTFFAGSATITGSAANDTLTGGTGNDRIAGGPGNDILTGRAGNDTITAGMGDDILTGGVGSDSLSGGVGSDRFFFNSPGQGGDTITDFSVADDTITVSRAGFGSGLSANPTEAPINSDQFTLGAAASSASHRFIYNNSTGGLFFDTDGNTISGAAQVQLAVLPTGLAMTNQDIFVTV